MQSLLRLLADSTRVRILLAVDASELAVNEIADVLAMSQSRISNHLRLLRQAGALRVRKEGAWTFYANALADDHPGAPLWDVVRGPAARERTARADARRRTAVLEERRRRSREHFAAASGNGVALETGTLREEALAALAPARSRVVDAGCGDGYLTEMLAERFDEVVAVDHSPERLAAAKKRVRSDRVRWHRGEIDALPLDDGEADAVFLSMVLHHVPEVAAALREAHRVLRPGGAVVIADLAPHDDESLRDRMGDLRLGLDPDELAARLRAAGFDDVRRLDLRDRLKTGPRKSLELFLTTGRRPAKPARAAAAKKTPRKKTRRTQGRTA